MNQSFQEQRTITDIEPAVYRHRCIFELRLNTPHLTRGRFAEFLKEVSVALSMKPHPEQPEPIITSATGHTMAKHNGLEGMLFWLESGLHAYWWEQPQLMTIDMHSCVFMNARAVEAVARDFFRVVEFGYLDITPGSCKTDSSKVEVRNHEKFGRGVFARERIAKGEFIAGFYGEIYEAEHALALPEVAVNHAIQFSEYKWRDGLIERAARYTNHSCNPNCGVSGLFDLVAMRDIVAGEELCWDYAMAEDSNWEAPGGGCLCGAANCRGRIAPYRQLSREERQKYGEHTSAWLIGKYAR